MISGNQELPKVLYIVPWQDPSGIPKIELDPNFTEHEVFRHLYPPAYKRELRVLRRAEVVGRRRSEAAHVHLDQFVISRNSNEASSARITVEHSCVAEGVRMDAEPCNGDEKMDLYSQR